MADYVAIRKYTSELINATLNDTIPPAVPDNLTIAELIEISQKGQMQYLLLHSLIKVVTNISDIEIIRKELEKSTIKTSYFLAMRNATIMVKDMIYPMLK